MRYLLALLLTACGGAVDTTEPISTPNNPQYIYSPEVAAEYRASFGGAWDYVATRAPTGTVELEIEITTCSPSGGSGLLDVFTAGAVHTITVGSCRGGAKPVVMRLPVDGRPIVHIRSETETLSVWVRLLGWVG